MKVLSERQLSEKVEALIELRQQLYEPRSHPKHGGSPCDANGEFKGTQRFVIGLFTLALPTL